MSRKLDFIPPIPNYDWVRKQMAYDLEYRLKDRHERTSLGRPLYYRINTQVIVTQECPYRCPFCIERKNPMEGECHLNEQLTALKGVLQEHPAARLTITGGEPGLYPGHVQQLLSVYAACSDNVFASINTSGYNPSLAGMAHINLSVNDYVKPDVKLFPGCTVQTVIQDTARLSDLKQYMLQTDNVKAFSFRYMSRMEKFDYDVTLFNELRLDKETHIGTFRVGDFFTYVTFDWNGRHARITLGDMYQQTHNDYQDGYSNIVIHPDGRIATNWR